MDFTLNIVGETLNNSGNSNKVKKVSKKLKKFSGIDRHDDFSIEFKQNNKTNAKAIVAKKRKMKSDEISKPKHLQKFRGIKLENSFSVQKKEKKKPDAISDSEVQQESSPFFVKKNKKKKTKIDRNSDDGVSDGGESDKRTEKKKLDAISDSEVQQKLSPLFIKKHKKKKTKIDRNSDDGVSDEDVAETISPSIFVKNIFNPDRQKRIDELRKNVQLENNQLKTNNNINKFESVKFGKFNNNKHKQEVVPIMGQRLVKPIYEKVFSGAPMDSLNFHPHTVKNIKDLLNISELTTVQQKVIPKILENHDILVRSQTGSGKTLAYALPIVEQLHLIRPKLTRNCGVQAVIVVPTRELAIQTYEIFIKLLKPFTWIVPGYLSGGEKRKSEKARLRKGINILVGTPGRLLDHLINTESLNFEQTRWLVLDEADRLFELGYEKDVSKIVEALNKRTKPKNPIRVEKPKVETSKNKIRFDDSDNEEIELKTEPEPEPEIKPIPADPSKPLQSILLSATLTSAVEKLAGLTLKNPIFIDNAAEKSKIDAPMPTNFDDSEKNEDLVIPSTITLNYCIVPPKLRLVALSGLIACECLNKKTKVLIFFGTQDLVDYHHDLMAEVLTKKIIDEDDENSGDDEPSENGILTGVRFYKLHGSMNQVERSGVFKAFCNAKSGILLTTDVAARGLDVPEVDLVIQYTPPQMVSEFVHRVGRTARAGRKGKSIVFLSPNETEYVRALEDKRIRISQIGFQQFLEKLVELCENEDVRNTQDAVYNLQSRFERLIDEDREMREKGGKAFISWVRYYSAFPRDLKHIFNIKVVHMGHFAKSFALKEPPTDLAKKHVVLKTQHAVNRLTYKNTEDNKKGKKRQHGDKFSYSPRKMNARTICLTTSEYDSGIPSKKRKKEY